MQPTSSPAAQQQELHKQHQVNSNSDSNGSSHRNSNKTSTTNNTNTTNCTNSNDNTNDNNNNANKPKRNPYCSRCRNHGKIAQVKGHKRHCEYRDCKCEGCQLVECRQIVSAAQIKRRRYQKQDEECGRRIEISPPVLSREPANDPATLIAKTLIGSASMKHHLQQQQQQQQQPHQHPNQQQQPQQQPGRQLPVSLANLPHLPNIHVSTTAAAPALPSATMGQPATSPPLPSYREQVNLVDELYQDFGPLAIYAWLRAEQFDLQKIRECIERSRIQYSDLLTLNSKYHPALPNSGSNNTIASAIGRSSSASADNQANGNPETSDISNQLAHNRSQASINTTRSLFWSDLKLAAGGVPPPIHHHHLLPHFIGHPFMTHQFLQSHHN